MTTHIDVEQLLNGVSHVVFLLAEPKPMMLMSAQPFLVDAHFTFLPPNVHITWDIMVSTQRICIDGYPQYNTQAHTFTKIHEHTLRQIILMLHTPLTNTSNKILTH